VFFVALVVSIVASLVVDVVVMIRMRIPAVSDASLPTAAQVDEGERRPGDTSTPRD
jgi:hypothetical protein